MSIGDSVKGTAHVETHASDREDRRRDASELAQPIVPHTWELPSGSLSAHEIAARGQLVERNRGMQSLDNAKLAESLSHMANFGNFNSENTSLLLVAAGRLAEHDVNRDVWRNHVPPVTDGVGDWELIAYKNLAGVAARFIVSRRLKEGPKYEARILIITASGLLVDCQVVDSQMADRFVAETIRYASYQSRMR